MADGLPPTPGPIDDSADPPRDGGAQPPPPLSSIRVKGPGAKGLNKPAILIAAGSGVALVLVLASGGFSGASSSKHADVKPMMSDPARPEMAQGAVRNLPSTYEEAATQQALIRPAQPPLLGPPLPGDVAAFAPNETRYQTEPVWSGAPDGGDGAPGQPDLAEREAQLADRSAIFFQVKQTEQTAAPAPTASPAPQSPLIALGPAPNDQQAPPSSGLSDRALHPGAIISASLITAINSEAPGPVIAQVTQAVYDSATGRNLLIPQGARLIGDYKSSARYGQSRIAIMWSRLIMPNGDEIVLDEAAVDPSGAAGIKGKVDNHWGEVFGAAALGTLINIGVAATEDQPSIGLTYGGVGISNYDPVQDALRDGVQRSAAIVTNRAVDRSLAIPPTIRVEAGTKMSVIATRRVSF
jgi:type IV secretion system protein TrbI